MSQGLLAENERHSWISIKGASHDGLQRRDFSQETCRGLYSPHPLDRSCAFLLDMERCPCAFRVLEPRFYHVSRGRPEQGLGFSQTETRPRTNDLGRQSLDPGGEQGVLQLAPDTLAWD